MQISNASGFMSDPGARTAVAEGLASMIGVPTDWVNVVLQFLSRRLHGVTPRILQDNRNVRMSYTITIPDTLQSTGILTNVTSALTNARPADVTSSISAALTQSVGAGAYTVIVSQMSTLVISTSTDPATTSTAHSRGAIPHTAQSEEDGDSRNTGLAVIISIFVILVVCACCGIVIVLVYVYRKRGEDGVVYEIGQHDASELRAAAAQNEHYPQVHVAQVGSSGAWAEPRQ